MMSEFEASLPGTRVRPVAAYKLITGKRPPSRRAGHRGQQLHVFRCCFTYAIACEGFVKIGRCNHLMKRLRAIRTSCPFPMRLLGFVEGPKEIRVHRDLARRGVERVSGEWFADTEVLRAVLHAMKFVGPELAA